MLNSICQLIREAGNTIIKFYDNNQLVNITHKLDNSPVTSADIAAHKIIIQGLKRISPEVPVLSEENPPDWKNRQYWHKYWLVDPLDGTKEFIKHNGEFTVNIALIEQGEPTLGVVYAPALNVMYFSSEGKAWKEENGHRIQINVREAYPPLVVVSRSHKDQNDKQLREYLYKLGEHKTAEIGSSLKFCLVAEGTAQIYPRFSPTNIWDIGAGHAVAVAAGAYVHDWQGNTLDYFPRQSFLNLGFHVSVF